MRTFLKKFMAVQCLCLLSALMCLGQAPLDELTLALQQREAITNNFRVIEGTEANQIADKVFRTLLATPTLQAGRSVEYSLFLIDDANVNAFSAAGGQVFITQGIASLVGNDFGVMAAVMSHELGHELLAHHYQSYLRKVEKEVFAQSLGALFQNNRNASDIQTLANWAGSAINLKLSRNEEIAADRLGLTILAEAGVHPDFAVTCFRRLAERGDQSKIEAFFSEHPRWVTREEKVTQGYDEALAAFRSRWPNAADSPAGKPPVVATLGAVKVSKDDKSKEATITFSYNVRNANEAKVVIAFGHKKAQVEAALPEYKLEDGSFGITQTIKSGASTEAEELSIHIPATALSGKERKLEATIRVIGDGEIAAVSKPFKVSFPKP